MWVLIAYILLFKFLLIFSTLSFATSFESIPLDNYGLDLGVKHKVSLEDAPSFLKNKHVLSLSNKQYVKYTINKKLKLSKGAIGFWIYPTWKDGRGSNTIFSTSWSDADNSYMVLSNGWWEPEGNNKLYFILSNQDMINCHTSEQLDTGKWNFVFMTWSISEKAQCKLYLNGIKVAQRVMDINKDRISQNDIYIGSDKATTERHIRKSEFDIADFKIYQNSFSDKQAYSLFSEYFSNENELNDFQQRWLQAESSGKKYSSDIENRVIFDESINWALSKQNTDEIIQRIKNAGFNVYVPCVWHGKGAYFKSEIFAMDERLYGKAYDPLTYLINKAHSVGIEVHPWFTVVRREGGILPEFAEDGVPDQAFNVHNPNYRKFIVDIMLDVVKRYDIDGINLDYIRSMGVCVSDQCIDDYRKKYGRNLVYDKYTSRIPVYLNHSIKEWNEGAVTDIVKTFSDKSRMIKPEIIISVDAHPVNKALLLQGQNSISWANNGYIDIIFNMDYKRRIDVQSMNEASELLNSKSKMIMLLSLFDDVDGEYVPRSSDLLNQYISYLKQNGNSNGIAFYHYVRLSDEQVIGLSQSAFSKRSITTWNKSFDD